MKIDYDLGLSQAFTDSAKNAQFSELAVDAIVPIVLNKKVAILTGALLEKTDFSVSPTSPDVKFYGLMHKGGSKYPSTMTNGLEHTCCFQN